MENEVVPDNRTKILDVALEMVQIYGFNAFSYRDLVAKVGVKTSTIHYYFPKKEDLGIALLQNYTDKLAQQLNFLKLSNLNPLEQFRGFVNIFDATAQNGSKLCLGGMVASDFFTFSADLQNAVRDFFTFAENWLAKLLEMGRNEGIFNFTGDATLLASLIMAALEGGLITGRVFGKVNHVAKIGSKLEVLLQVS